MSDEDKKIPEAGTGPKVTRAALQVAGGAVPLVGGFLAAVAGAWSERDQDKVNRFFEHWVRMIQDEIREKEKTVAEVMARLDLQDEKITKRLESECLYRSSVPRGQVLNLEFCETRLNVLELERFPDGDL